MLPVTVKFTGTVTQVVTETAAGRGGSPDHELRVVSNAALRPGRKAPDRSSGA